MNRFLSLLLLVLLASQAQLRAQRAEIPLTIGDRITITIGGVPAEEVAQISKV